MALHGWVLKNIKPWRVFYWDMGIYFYGHLQKTLDIQICCKAFGNQSVTTVGVLQLWFDTWMNFQTLSTMVDSSDCLQQLTKQDIYHSFKEKLVKWMFL